MKNLKEFFKEKAEEIKPSDSDVIKIEKNLKEILNEINKKIKKGKIESNVFVGGSYAKGTLIKKENYDIDIFVRFDENYSEEEIAKLFVKIVPIRAERKHGSRDYFSFKKDGILFEIIPTIEVSNPERARNITDLSYFHVNYVKKKIKKDKKLADEIRLAKAFIHYADCYGAESYINGFSGYATELIIIFYKSLINFIKAIAKKDIYKGKIIIDIEKKYKSVDNLLKNMNESKLNSPIILIDPTFKERNALASLSNETLAKLKEQCTNFLKAPSNYFFIQKNKEDNFIKKHGKNAIEIELKTDKQTGDIAGTKLKKFYLFLINQIRRYFDVKDSEFIYSEKDNLGKMLIVAIPIKEIIVSGPSLDMKEAVNKFKLAHRKTFKKDGKFYAKEKGFSSLSKFIDYFKNKYADSIDKMSITHIKLIKD